MPPSRRYKITRSLLDLAIDFERDNAGDDWYATYAIASNSVPQTGVACPVHRLCYTACDSFFIELPRTPQKSLTESSGIEHEM